MELERRLQWIRRLAVVAVAMTFVLMVLGAWVKANGAGLSCPDWPACYGKYLPPFPSIENGGTWTHEVDGVMVTEDVPYTQAQELYEWGHRAVVALIAIPILLWAIFALPGDGLNRPVRLLPGLAVLVYILQAALGAVTVLVGNKPWATTMHLMMAVIWFFIQTSALYFTFLRPLAGTTDTTPPKRGPVVGPRTGSHESFDTPVAPFPGEVHRVR